MNRFPLYIFDLDGTLYRGAEAIPHAVKVVNQLRADGSKIAYLTNNSSQTRTFYRDKLHGMGFHVELEEVYSSALGSAAHLNQEGNRTAFVVGMPGLVETLETAQIHVVNKNPFNHAQPSGEQASAVVAGICLEFTYQLLAGAMNQISNGAEFIATNADATFPMEGGKLTPGAGSIVAAIQTCSGKKPFVVGKPNPFLVRLILSDTGIDSTEALSVGDRMDTDIASGVAAGTPTHLVLTGVESKAPPDQSFSKDLRGLLS